MNKSEEIKTEVSYALNEKKRVYTFITKEGIMFDISLENVVELFVRPNGSHRLKTADGKLHYIPSGFYHIAITDDKKEWTL